MSCILESLEDEDGLYIWDLGLTVLSKYLREKLQKDRMNRMKSPNSVSVYSAEMNMMSRQDESLLNHDKNQSKKKAGRDDPARCDDPTTSLSQQETDSTFANLMKSA
jgi:hypothetical protein